MGRTKSAKSKAEKEATSESPRGGALKSFLFGGDLEDGARARLREIAGIASLGFALFLFVSLVSYRQPYNDPQSAGWNWCGQVGWYVAHIVKATIGNAGFLLTFLFGSWGACSAPCAADLDGSGAVGGEDLTLVLGSWGDC